jgi:putative transposase
MRTRPSSPCTLCAVRSGLHQRLLRVAVRPPSRRAIDDAVVLERIRTIHAESDATYGMPRVGAELVEQGLKISGKRVARLMRCNAIRGVSRRRRFVVSRQRDQRQRPAPDLVKREFRADGPNQRWVVDMTYVPTWAGFIYLAIVLNVWSRRVVGLAIGEQMTAELVLAALNMALQQRRPADVIPHSDHGSQYTSVAFGQRCKKMGCAAVDRHRGRRLRQCHGRGRRRHAGMGS